MAQMPTVNNDDMIVCGAMGDPSASGHSGTILLCPPAKARLKQLLLTTSVAPNADITFTLSSKHGTLAPTWVLANASAVGTYRYDAVQHDRANDFDAESPLIVASDAGGTAGGATGFCAIFQRA